MLPAHIVEELLRRERHERERDLERPQPELTLPLPEPPARHVPAPSARRGVEIIPVMG